MFQDFWKVTKTLVTLADDLQKYSAELKEIRKELRDLTIIVHALAQEIKHSKDTQDLKHQNHLLEVKTRMEELTKLLPDKSRRKKITKKPKT